MIRDRGYEPGQSWRAEAEWFGGPHARASRPPTSFEPQEIESSGVRAGWHQWPHGDGFSAAQRYEIDRAIRAAETVCRYEFSVYVGAADGEAGPVRPAGCTPPCRASDRSVLVMVDPAARLLEVVTGSAVRRDLTDDSVRLAAVAMQAAFAEGDLVGGIKRGLAQLAEAARKPTHAARRLSPPRAAGRVSGRLRGPVALRPRRGRRRLGRQVARHVGPALPDEPDRCGVGGGGLQPGVDPPSSSSRRGRGEDELQRHRRHVRAEVLPQGLAASRGMLQVGREHLVLVADV